MTDRYEILLADPPWRHSSTRGPGNRRAASRQYDTMTTAEICALWRMLDPVTTPIARLFLWCPDSMLPDGLQVMSAWGFRYVKAVFVWVKLTRREIPNAKPGEEPPGPGEGHLCTPEYGYRKLAFGAGRTTRNGAELCLLGARGSMPVWSKAERQVILAPQREHSRKPDEQYTRIEAMYPNRRYLELFARARRRGWAAWGLECDRFNEAAE